MRTPFDRALISGAQSTLTTTCRETADAGQIPDGTSPGSSQAMGAGRLGQHPADSLLAVPTRENQSGGALIPELPARRAHPSRPPPSA